MYNLDVAVADTFHVGQGQWLVHNSAPCTSLLDRWIPGVKPLAERGPSAVRQGDKAGDYGIALDDFKDLADRLGVDPSDIRPLANSEYEGYMFKAPDGSFIIVRSGSKWGPPTIEHHVDGKIKYKVRYK
ncbi:hypothetical protein [Calidithermus chliarophilus]|uniref:hypothetical protein n=1 Tax=Calidithermus chliarophilus TaxID=52023 RepID=UPI0003FA27F7|nr:hypothetical protein [Calidithermus chliarophilus]